jgi:hypothetical protein
MGRGRSVKKKRDSFLAVERKNSLGDGGDGELRSEEIPRASAHLPFAVAKPIFCSNPTANVGAHLWRFGDSKL